MRTLLTAVSNAEGMQRQKTHTGGVGLQTLMQDKEQSIRAEVCTPKFDEKILSMSVFTV
jgi:hypothetical protein